MRRVTVDCSRSPRQGKMFLLTVAVTAALFGSFAFRANAADSTGVITLVRPDAATLSATNVTIETHSQTNYDLTAVGQIPVLITNISYQLIITNADVINIYYDTLVLTNSPVNPNGQLFSCTDILLTNIASYITNYVTGIIPVGEIPVLATNIVYQFVITNPDVLSLFYDSLVLTNATPGGAVNPWVCEDVLVTNIVGDATNVVTVGTTCTVSNNYTVLTIVTNSIPEIQYTTLVSTNLYFDAADPLCWQTVYHTNTVTSTVSETNLVAVGTTCVASNNLTTLTIVTNSIPVNIQYYIQSLTNMVFDANNPACWQTIYQTNGVNVTTASTTNTFVLDYPFCVNSSVFAYGSLTMEKRGLKQRFTVTGLKLLANPTAPPAGLAVFLGGSWTNEFGYVAPMKLLGLKEGTYRLELESPAGAPPALGVADLTDLAGLILQIRDPQGCVYLETIIPPLVPEPSQLSFSLRHLMGRPAPEFSPKATGTIEARYDGSRGSSRLRIRAKKLTNSSYYTVTFLLPNSSPTYLLYRNQEVRWDTRFGQQLPGGATTVAELSGTVVEIRDSFGVLHLVGTIP